MSLQDAQENIKKRSPNWTEAERLALTEAIKDRHAILFGKLDNNLTSLQKSKAWGEVLAAVNSVSSVQRTLSQCQEKYKGLKKDTKAAVANNNREIKKTGGGKADIVKLDKCSENIIATIPEAAIKGIEGGIDTSEATDAGTGRNLEVVFHIPNPRLALATSVQQVPAIPVDVNEQNERNRQQHDGTSCEAEGLDHQDTPQWRTAKRSRFQSTNEILFERQVRLIEEQTDCMKALRSLMKERNDIEREKLQLMKSRMGSGLYQRSSETSVNFDGID